MTVTAELQPKEHIADVNKMIKNLIVMPLYNQIYWTKKALETMYLGEDDALLLINNGSTDETRKHCLELAKIDGVFFLDLPHNVGVSSAWNMGLDFAFNSLKCETCIILNNDILLLPTTLSTMQVDLKKEGIGLATAFNMSANLPSEKEFFALIEKPEGNYIEEPDFSCFGINKKCYETVGPFDENFYPAYFEDNDYHYRMRQSKLTATKNRENHYWHYGSKSIKIDQDTAEWLGYCYGLNADYYEKKWGGSPGKEIHTTPFGGADFERQKAPSKSEYLKNCDRLNP